MINKYWVHQLMLLIIHCSNTSGWVLRPFKIIFTEIQGSITELSNTTAWIGNSSLGNPAIFVDYDLHYRAEESKVNILLMQVRRNDDRPLYVNSTFDVCEAFRKVRLSPILRGIYKTTSSHVDMPLKCPMEKGLYHVTKLGDIEEEFPPYTPFNTYKLRMVFFIPRTKLNAILTVKFRVIQNHSKRERSKPRG